MAQLVGRLFHGARTASIWTKLAASAGALIGGFGGLHFHLPSHPLIGCAGGAVLGATAAAVGARECLARVQRRRTDRLKAVKVSGAAGAAGGAVAGAAAGAVGGPLGIVAGAAVGSSVGDKVGRAVAGSDAGASDESREELGAGAGAAAGAVAGAVVGSVAGPAGLAAGARVGATAGEIVGRKTAAAQCEAESSRTGEGRAGAHGSG